MTSQSSTIRNLTRRRIHHELPPLMPAAPGRCKFRSRPWSRWTRRPEGDDDTGGPVVACRETVIFYGSACGYLWFNMCLPMDKHVVNYSWTCGWRLRAGLRPVFHLQSRASMHIGGARKMLSWGLQWVRPLALFAHCLNFSLSGGRRRSVPTVLWSGCRGQQRPWRFLSQQKFG